MTPTEKKVYNFIEKYKDEYGYVPTHVAIANEYEKSRQWATKMIANLKVKGYLGETGRFGLYEIPGDN